jgi:SAM-dependent methyltransferase
VPGAFVTLKGSIMEKDNVPEFDFDAAFDPDDYLYFYKEVEFLAKQLGLDAPAKILDLACGHGRHANRLAELGHDVTGVDRSAGFLAIAGKDGDTKGVTVNYMQQDIREITFAAEFDVVIMMFVSFGYFSDEENFRVLQNVARALKPGGLFCLDIGNRDAFMRLFAPHAVKEIGGDLMIDRRSFDIFTGRLVNKRIMIRNGKRKDAPHYVRLYNYNEIQDLLARAGFEIRKVFGDLDARPLAIDAIRMVIIARKK